MTRSARSDTRCGMEGCDRPQYDPLREGHASVGDPLKRCALHEIASYNAEELVEWGEENAADMVEYARQQLVIEGGR